MISPSRYPGTGLHTGPKDVVKPTHPPMSSLLIQPDHVQALSSEGRGSGGGITCRV